MEFIIEIFRYFCWQNIEPEAETGEIGPNFNSKQFFGMIKRVSKSSWQNRCKKISGDDTAFAKALTGKDEFETCFENWQGVDEIMKSVNHTKETGEYKSMFKA